jgi:predicted nucleic acid-binding protein
VTARSVVLDANIYVSALVFGGKPKRALQLAITGRVHASVAEPIRNEVRRTLRSKSAGQTSVSPRLTA